MTASDQHAIQPRERDPGLQAERTALAWSRTALAVLANGLLALRAGWVSRQPMIIALALALALLLAAAATVVYGAWRRRQLLNGQRPVAPSARVMRAAASIGLATCTIGLAAICVT